MNRASEYACPHTNMLNPSLLRIDTFGTRHADPATRPRLLVPGSFNPLHDGHWGLASAAATLIGQAPAFELSRANVDKPELCDDEVARRVSQFAGRADVWITDAPRFFEKASLFPQATFAIGADTAARLVDARYHENDTTLLDASLQRIVERECRFLVAARVDASGRLVALEDLALPSRWRDLFRSIPTSLFRLDISSTNLRDREGSS
jgi:nicotinic acid mononucleotide adenylyltransferase